MTEPATSRLRLVLSQLIDQLRMPLAPGKIVAYPRLRNFVLDVLREGRRKQVAHILLKADIAGIKERLAALRERGYSVSRNKPYAGGFITEHYGNPTAGLHSVQLEINRGLYMDERRFERSKMFATVARDMEAMADRLNEIALHELRPYRAAAE